MGSPYQTTTLVTVSTVRSMRGYRSLVRKVCASMGVSSGKFSEWSAERRLLSELHQAFLTALSSRSRVVIILEARYAWTGYEEFQRAVVIDFTHPERADEPSKSSAICDLGNVNCDVWNSILDRVLS